MKSNFSQLDQEWASLGINYAIPVSKLDPLVDPEDLIIRSLSVFYEDPRLLSIFLAWVGEYGDLLNMHRLESCCKKLSPFELAILGAISLKLSSSEKWKRLLRRVEKRQGRNSPRFDAPFRYQKLSEVSGVDKEFEKFGICIPRVKPSDLKKVKPKASVIKKNIWFRIRILMDNYMRADAAVAMFVLGIPNAYQLGKRLGYSPETSYRHFHSLQVPLIGKQVRLMAEEVA